MPSQPNPRINPEEYLEIDRHSESKHEYMFGEIKMVPGGSPQHSLITANVCIALGKQLTGSTHRIFDSSLRVCLDRKTAYYVYPDLTIVDGALEFLEGLNETLVNPKVVIEVLAPTSLNVELGSKARMYTRVPSITDLLMIDQDRIAIEHWVRQPNDHWDVALVQDASAVMRMESLGCGIPVSEFYAGVEWPKV